MKDKSLQKYINLKPNFKKGSGSIVITLFLPIVYWFFFCRNVGCILGVSIPLLECGKWTSVFSCCRQCILTSTHQLQLLLLGIFSFLIIYIVWSLIEVRLRNENERI